MAAMSFGSLVAGTNQSTCSSKVRCIKLLAALNLDYLVLCLFTTNADMFGGCEVQLIMGTNYIS